MTALTLYGAPNSRTSRVLWLLEEMAIDYRHVPVIQASRLTDPRAPTAQKNTLSPDFLRLNPAGTVPVLDDGRFVLTESLAILMHVATSRGSPLGPLNQTEMSRIHEILFWVTSTIEPDAVKVIVNRVIRDAPACDTSALMNAEARLARNLHWLEDRLTEAWLLGARFTLADIAVAEILRYAQSAPGLLGSFAKVSDWLGRCQSRPAALKIGKLRQAEILPDGWQRAYAPQT